MSSLNFDYNLEKDQSVFISKKIILSNKNPIDINACTVAGSKDGITPKLNEDAFFITQIGRNTLFLCVIDGDSSVRPTPSLKSISGARYSSHNLRTLLKKIVNPSLSAEQIITLLNEKIRKKVSLFSEFNFKDSSTLPGSSITLIKLDFKKNSGELVSVGDTLAIFFYKNHTSKLITNDLVKRYDDKTFSLIKKIAIERNIPIKEARQNQEVKTQIRLRYKEIINRKDKLGYGILNGQLEVNKYVQKELFNLNDLTNIFLGSDGIIPLNFDSENNKDQKNLLKILEKGSLQKLVLSKQSLENNDPNYNKYVRYKHSDDATAIYLHLN